MAEPQPKLSIARNMKIGAFHIGSAMADVLGSGVWNRVMIQNLGYAATPVSFLLALRYFLAPISAWAGERSDRTDVRGYRRLPWVWGGRVAMIVGYMIIAFSTIELVRYGDFWWLGIILGFIITSVGQSVSGSTFLALVYDRATDDGRGRAVGVVWTFLLAGYAVAGVLFARLLPEYQEAEFVGFFALAGLIMGAIWFFATVGEEAPRPRTETVATPSTPKTTLQEDLQGILGSRSARMLALFMLVSFVAAFMQDTILEPFGGAVFGMPVGETTRFQAYWGTMAILSSVAALVMHGRWRAIAYKRLARWGVVVLLFTFSFLSLIAVQEIESMLRMALIMLGVGYGLWNIGTVGLMVEHSRAERAGLDLGIWTVVATVCRGGGVFLGGILFDTLNLITEETALAYGLVFAVEAALLLIALPLVSQIGSDPMPQQPAPAQQELVLTASMD